MSWHTTSINTQTDRTLTSDDVDTPVTDVIITRWAGLGDSNLRFHYRFTAGNITSHTATALSSTQLTPTVNASVHCAVHHACGVSTTVQPTCSLSRRARHLILSQTHTQPLHLLLDKNQYDITCRRVCAVRQPCSDGPTTPAAALLVAANQPWPLGQRRDRRL